MRALSPLAHLHLLGIHFHLCKLHPASVWLIPLWSVSGRHHRYCWSPHCTAKQFQIVSVEIEKSIDILPSRAIMYTMNILILFSQCAICVTHSPRLVLGWLVLHLIVKASTFVWQETKDCVLWLSYFYMTKKKGWTKVQEIALGSLTFSTETKTTANADKRAEHKHHNLTISKGGEQISQTPVYRTQWRFNELSSDMSLFTRYLHTPNAKQANPRAVLMN